jgi:hypothetical protein
MAQSRVQSGLIVLWGEVSLHCCLCRTSVHLDGFLQAPWSWQSLLQVPGSVLLPGTSASFALPGAL